MKYEELEKLHELKEKGILSEAEYQAQKEKLLNDDRSTISSSFSNISSKDLFGLSEPNYCMLLHLSQFAGFVLPILGFVLPLFMWLSQKDNNPTVDAHGKIVMNWIISSLIYTLVGFILTFILIGAVLLIVLAVLCVVFGVMGALKANEGKVWKYPLTIEFIK